MNFKSWIIHETDWWIAINKPAGLIVEKSPFEPTTIESVAWPYLEKHQRGKKYLGIVHRLDRVTSGVLLLAKRKTALRYLNQQFADRVVEKEYLAVVEGAPPKSEERLKHYLVKDQATKKAIVHTLPKPKSTTVVLDYRRLSESNGRSLLQIIPKTGKFHQIRAQLAAIGCPIVRDSKYGAQGLEYPKEIGLHAARLTFIDPQSEKELTIEAPPLGPDFHLFAKDLFSD
ncbi:MAG: RNA pseudouridine synthase [Bacteroidota bacterium]